MGRRSSRLRTHRLPLSAAGVTNLAREMVTLHEQHMASGFLLTGSSAVWKRDDGSFTARFVYRIRREPAESAIAYTIRWRPS